MRSPSRTSRSLLTDWCEGIGLSGSYELPYAEPRGRSLTGGQRNASTAHRARPIGPRRAHGSPVVVGQGPKPLQAGRPPETAVQHAHLPDGRATGPHQRGRQLKGVGRP